MANASGFALEDKKIKSPVKTGLLFFYSVSEEELSADYIIPKAFDRRVGDAVAKAVYDTAVKEGWIPIFEYFTP